MTVVTDSYVKIALNAVPVNMEDWSVANVLYVFTVEKRKLAKYVARKDFANMGLISLDVQSA